MTVNYTDMIADRLWMISEQLLRVEASDAVDQAIENLCQIAFQLSSDAANESAYRYSAQVAIAE